MLIVSLNSFVGAGIMKKKYCIRQRDWLEGIVGSSPRAPLSLSNHVGFVAWLLYSNTLHSPKGYIQLKTGWAQGALRQWSLENRYFHVDFSRWLRQRDISIATSYHPSPRDQLVWNTISFLLSTCVLSVASSSSGGGHLLKKVVSDPSKWPDLQDWSDRVDNARHT